MLGIACSPRKGKATFFALRECLAAAAEAEPRVETELIELAGLDIGGCVACGRCREEPVCSSDDDFNGLVPRLSDPEVGGMVIATPVYLRTMASQCKAFLDRTILLKRNGARFRNRIAGVLAIGQVRNGGQELTIQAVQATLLAHDMRCVSGAALWSGGPGGVEGDEAGLEAAREVGRRVAEVAAMQRTA
jgi:multimeric flavodoxin WrbA